MVKITVKSKIKTKIRVTRVKKIETKPGKPVKRTKTEKQTQNKNKVAGKANKKQSKKKSK